MDVNFKFFEIGHMSIFINDTDEWSSNWQLLFSYPFCHSFMLLCVFTFVFLVLVCREKTHIKYHYIKREKQKTKKIKTLASDSVLRWISSQWSGYQLYVAIYLVYPSNTLSFTHIHTNTHKIRFFRHPRNFVWQCVYVRLCFYTYFNSNWTSCWNSPQHCVIIYNIIRFENKFYLYFRFTIYFC